ncbi:hypothetical protein C8A05DRAFT_14278 [Staphylotrichum tortipilum]|uniref:SprT-like domain-containing protein n=1 Tax=Staphylotrichum tortipilum TaxID=2831512 RepID=A0AAN6RVA3_9PEZI|nr:hypothetical protein C8A05DRAFT_14278 [Staphylotrichum longicolle]
MALPVAGGDEYPPFRPSGAPYYPVKRRTGDAVDEDDHYYHARHKRPRHVQHVQRPQHSQFTAPVAFRVVDNSPAPYPPLHQPLPRHCPPRYPSPLPHVPSADLAGTAAPAMERTASGHSIRQDPAERSASTELLDEREAAQRVRAHLASFKRRNPDSKHERILRSIINPRPRRHNSKHHHHHHHHRAHHHPSPSRHDDPKPSVSEEEEYPLDNAALESIFSAANEIFFNGRLSQRVAWDWSHASAARYDDRVVGTTALRRAAATTRGFETLIVLSSPILRDARYSRRLLISTFLHELIHCYLFICCGFRARWCGGHTEGFRDIAGVIDEWVGEGGGLFLSRVEADLELFRAGRCGGEDCEGEGGGGVVERGEGSGGGSRPAGNVYPCSGMAAGEQEDDVVVVTPAVGVGASSGAREVVYLGSGSASHSRTADLASQEVVYLGRGISPVSRTGTPTPEQYYSDGSRSRTPDNSGWRQRRRLRPLYVYMGDEPTASYVYPDTMSQRP